MRNSLHLVLDFIYGIKKSFKKSIPDTSKTVSEEVKLIPEDRRTILSSARSVRKRKVNVPETQIERKKRRPEKSNY